MGNFIDDLAAYASLSAIVAALVAVGAVIKFGLEYTKKNALSRFENFQKMRDIGRSDKFISEVIDCLRADERGEPGAGERLRTLDVKKKHRFLGFFEEIAIMHDSGLIDTDVAHYMFGYFCIRCLETDEFWKGMGKDSYYWSLLIRFAKLMKEIESKRVKEYESGKASFRKFKF